MRKNILPISANICELSGIVKDFEENSNME